MPALATSDQDADIEVSTDLLRPTWKRVQFFQQVDAGGQPSHAGHITTATVEQQLENAPGLYGQLKHERLTRHVPQEVGRYFMASRLPSGIT